MYVQSQTYSTGHPISIWAHGRIFPSLLHSRFQCRHAMLLPTSGGEASHLKLASGLGSILAIKAVQAQLFQIHQSRQLFNIEYPLLMTYHLGSFQVFSSPFYAVLDCHVSYVFFCSCFFRGKLMEFTLQSSGKKKNELNKRLFVADYF